MILNLWAADTITQFTDVLKRSTGTQSDMIEEVIDILVKSEEIDRTPLKQLL